MFRFFVVAWIFVFACGCVSVSSHKEVVQSFYKWQIKKKQEQYHALYEDVVVKVQQFRKGKIVFRGNGVLISPRGYVLTVYHVVQGKGKKQNLFVQVRRKEGGWKQYKARLVRYQPSIDIALLKIVDRKPYQRFAYRPLRVRFLEPNETIIVCGYVRNYLRIYEGVVSLPLAYPRPKLFCVLKGKTYPVFFRIMRLDGLIWFGMSGSPIFTQKGELVGVCMAMFAKDPSWGIFLSAHFIEWFKLLPEN